MRNYRGELSPEDRVRSRRTVTNRDPTLTADFTFGHRCSNRAIAFPGVMGEDFLLVVSYDEPHEPHLCLGPFSEMYVDYRFPKKSNVKDTLEGKPEHPRVWAGEAVHWDRDALTLHRPWFFSSNRFVDGEVGRVLEAVNRWASEAFVIYTSDHGDMLQSHGLDGKGAAMYEKITHVPFLARWPGRISAGAVSRALVSHVDVVPTILEVMGLPIPKCLEGRKSSSGVLPSRRIRARQGLHGVGSLRE